MSLRDLLLQTVSTPARKDVSHLIPGLNGQGPVYVQELSAAQLRQWSQDNDRERHREGQDRKLPADANARLVILTLVGTDGAPVFRPEDREALMRTTGLVNRLAEVAGNLAGVWGAAEDPLPNAHSTSPSTAPPPGAE